MANRYAEILRYQPTESGSYEYTDRRPLPDGDAWEAHFTCSEEGLKRMILHAELVERWSEHLAAIQEALPPRCEDHGQPWAELDGLSWSVNDYVCEPERDPQHVDFILNGFHDTDVLCDRFCVVQWAHSVPAGLIAWGREDAR